VTVAHNMNVQANNCDLNRSSDYRTENNIDDSMLLEHPTLPEILRRMTMIGEVGGKADSKVRIYYSIAFGSRYTYDK
jgi:hypothetical protein